MTAETPQKPSKDMTNPKMTMPGVVPDGGDVTVCRVWSVIGIPSQYRSDPGVFASGYQPAGITVTDVFSPHEWKLSVHVPHQTSPRRSFTVIRKYTNTLMYKRSQSLSRGMDDCDLLYACMRNIRVFAG
jgi:hypothetical protein